MATSRLGVLCLVLVGCGADLDVRSIRPALGSVEGGTRVTIEGSGFDSDARVTIGGIECGAIVVDGPSQLSCMTGTSSFLEGAMDVVVVTGAGEQATLPAAFTYECPWTTSTGRRSCGAAPPGLIDEAPVATFVTQFEAGHGFVANPDGQGRSNVDDTTDFALGDRSAFIETDGAGTPRTLQRFGMPAIDMRDHVLKLWLKVDNVKSAAAIDVRVGDSNLARFFRFRLRSGQGQQWMTDGDWVAVTVSWAPDNVTVVGAPSRSAITDISFRLVDDGTGVPVRLHVNAIALVREPMDRYPSGVVSFTFDDNWSDMVTTGARALDRHDFPASAYVIVDSVDRSLRASLTDLRDLQAKGWDIAAHSFTGVHHDARLPTLPADVVEDDLVDTRAWLMQNGFGAYDHCAYPGGDFSYGGESVLPIAARYFTSCRTIYEGQREIYPAADPLKLRVFYVTSASTLESAKAAVDCAVSHREWVILVFHKLVDGTPTLLTEWPARDFEALVDYVARSQVPVETVSRVLR